MLLRQAEGGRPLRRAGGDAGHDPLPLAQGHLVGEELGHLVVKELVDEELSPVARIGSDGKLEMSL